jgi:hypothetical protein
VVIAKIIPAIARTIPKLSTSCLRVWSTPERSWYEKGRPALNIRHGNEPPGYYNEYSRTAATNEARLASISSMLGATRPLRSTGAQD